MALAVLRAELEAGRATSFPRRPSAQGRFVLLLAFAAFMAARRRCSTGTSSCPGTGWRPTWRSASGSGLLVLAVIVPRDRAGAARAPCSGSPMCRVGGHVSYGIYLWHLPALELIERASAASHRVRRPTMQPRARWVAVVAAAVASARPASTWLSGPLQQAPGAGAAARRAPTPRTSSPGQPGRLSSSARQPQLVGGSGRSLGRAAMGYAKGKSVVGLDIEPGYVAAVERAGLR